MQHPDPLEQAQWVLQTNRALVGYMYSLEISIGDRAAEKNNLDAAGVTICDVALTAEWLVQTKLEQNPFSGMCSSSWRRGDLLKCCGERRWTLPVCQATGARTLRVAAGQ